MRPDARFQHQSKQFWANVRTISQHIGYTVPRAKEIRVPTLEEIISTYRDLGLNHSAIIDQSGTPSDFVNLLLSYFHFRAITLNGYVQQRLMDLVRAKNEFRELKSKLCPRCPLPMNKQKGKKKGPAFLTGITNMLIEANLDGFSCDYDPRELTTITANGVPLRTLARRVDGAFPSPVNPIAIWEIKEYYYTTTFGSRVADGVYETLLDGLELEELRAVEKIDVKHYLMLDDRFTWWECGRSYLCRVIDMLHMGYVDEVLFGFEVIERLPSLVKEWVALARARELLTR